MNEDQTKNIKEAIRIIGERIFKASGFLYVLKGLQSGAQARPETLENHKLALNYIYIGLFDALSAAIGTIVDSTKNTYSIPSLINKIRRYKIEDRTVKRVIDKIIFELSNATDDPLSKLKHLRHDLVAHNTPDGQSEAFYAANKLNLAEVEAELAKLENMLNEISIALFSEACDWRSGDREQYFREAESLLNR